MNCRGEENRKKIVKDNKLEPISCIRLLEPTTSCTGDLLTHTCYYFSYINLKDPIKKGEIKCGKHAADHFFSLLHTEPLKEFNPFRTDIGNNTSIPQNSSDSPQNGNNVTWDPLSEELKNAINMLFICWKLKHLKEPLLGILRDLNKYPSSKPYISRIKAVNRVISYDKKKRKLIEMINELRADKPNLKSFSFPLINAELKKHNETSYIGE